MAQLKEKLVTETIIPFFNLSSTKGGSISTWDFKQRKNLVIYFFGGIDCAPCRETLKKFADNYYNYRRLNTEVLAIGTDSLANLSGLARELNLPFPLLSDADAKTANKYTYINPETNLPYPSIFVADKYGSLEEEWIAKDESGLPAQEKVLALLELLELRCPE